MHSPRVRTAIADRAPSPAMSLNHRYLANPIFLSSFADQIHTSASEPLHPDRGSHRACQVFLRPRLENGHARQYGMDATLGMKKSQRKKCDRDESDSGGACVRDAGKRHF